ncbi:M16 family metallopeptidase [Geomobilimonas luticola]|uniref:Insulinase family protein n=1 Tax=Geomobilimonas luticola TaxID=1114878 RepID=A0ABS5SD03_9BACT|nr:pitrilysin family protein [Geomobilimonas luticola]MBT0653259.1 insulinase family protein [Geomobilimonas luticola]
MRKLPAIWLPIILLCTLAAGCATAPKMTDPRTLTYAPLTFTIPKSERVQLSNGMVVYLLEDHELPLVNMTAYVRTGSIYEPADKVGLAGLTGAVMRSGGTASLPPEKLDGELEFMASSIESSIGADAGNVSLATLARNLDRTLELFAQVLRKPAFREDRVTLARKRAIEGLRRQNDDPKGVADRELRKKLYEGHPLGRYPTIATVEKITRDDLVAFHRRFYHPNNTILAVAGDFKREEMLARLNAAFAGWEQQTVDLPPVPQPRPDVKPAVLLAPKDISQSVIRMGHLGIDKDNPDLYAIRVMDYILGGGFTSRLTTEIRSNQGLAYNVDSYFDIGRRFTGIFLAETETKAESTAKAINLMRNIITGMTRAPVTDQELALAKDSIVNSFLFGFTKPDVIVNQQARLEYYAYPPGYLENYRDRIAKVTREDVLRVARQYLHPDAMVLMVVGDPKKLDQPLTTFGPLQELNLENGR